MIYSNVARVKSQLGVRGYKNGKPFQKLVTYSPTLFVRAEKGMESKAVHKSLLGEPMLPVRFDSIWRCDQWIKQFEGVANHSVHGNKNYDITFLSDQWPGDVPGSLEDLSVCYLDIETECEHGFPNIELANEVVNVITVMNSKTSQYNVFCLGDVSLDKDDVVVHSFSNEKEMLYAFLSHWVDQTPDIITGWNSRFFDIPYLVRRIVNVLGWDFVQALSPFGMVKERTVTINDREQLTYQIVGISHLDLMDLYKKFTYITRESYSLDFVSSVELGEKKLDYSEFKSFREFYRTDFKTFVVYNIKDVELVYRLNQKLRLLELVVMIAYMAKVNFEDVLSPVRTWDALFFNHLRKQKIVVPPSVVHSKSKKYQGAFVIAPKTDVYDWVMSYDLNALYPSIIQLINISPETLASKNPKTEMSTEDLVKNGLSQSHSGYVFQTEKEGFIPYLMDMVYSQRKVFNKKKLEAAKELAEIEAELKRRGFVL